MAVPQGMIRGVIVKLPHTRDVTWKIVYWPRFTVACICNYKISLVTTHHYHLPLEPLAIMILQHVYVIQLINPKLQFSMMMQTHFYSYDQPEVTSLRTPTSVHYEETRTNNNRSDKRKLTPPKARDNGIRPLFGDARESIWTLTFMAWAASFICLVCVQSNRPRTGTPYVSIQNYFRHTVNATFGNARATSMQLISELCGK